MQMFTREPHADVRINRVQLTTQPKPEDIIKTLLGKRSSIYIFPAKEKTLKMGLGGE